MSWPRRSPGLDHVGLPHARARDRSLARVRHGSSPAGQIRFRSSRSRGNCTGRNDRRQSAVEDWNLSSDRAEQAACQDGAYAAIHADPATKRKRMPCLIYHSYTSTRFLSRRYILSTNESQKRNYKVRNLQGGKVSPGQFDVEHSTVSVLMTLVLYEPQKPHLW